MKTSFAEKGFLVLLLFFCRPQVSRAYSVLTHEALVDVCWNTYLVPLLQQKYAPLDSAQLHQAHAYAYGGAVAADMGYYPFGSKLFTNLVHYVRTGDFVKALLEESSNADEYAFALGMLCHYYADVYGHRLGVNVSVPVEYPKVMEKFGNVVTYAQDRVAHKRVEFAFDVMETAKGNYASRAYRDFIGFQVADSVLERAFYKTYGLHLDEVFPSFYRAVNTFRWSVKNIFPGITKAAWSSRKSSIKRQHPTMTARQFRYKMSRANYNKEFGRKRDKPGVLSFLFGELFKLLPKVGPLAPLKFKAPGPAAEKLLVQSFDSAQMHYSNSLKMLSTQKLLLIDKDLDTGKDTRAGEYQLADKTWGEWLLTLKDKDLAFAEDALKQDLLRFFNNGQLLYKENKRSKKQIENAIFELKDSRAATSLKDEIKAAGGESSDNRY